MGKGKLHSDPCLCSYPPKRVQSTGIPRSSTGWQQVPNIPSSGLASGARPQRVPWCIGGRGQQGPSKVGRVEWKTPLAPLPFQLSSCPGLRQAQEALNGRVGGRQMDKLFAP